MQIQDLHRCAILKLSYQQIYFKNNFAEHKSTSERLIPCLLSSDPNPTLI